MGGGYRPAVVLAPEAPPPPRTAADAAFDPWRVADGRADLTVAFTPVASLLGGAFVARRDGHSVIALDPALSDGGRRAALTHELVHDERGGVADPPDAPTAWAAVVDREERRVDREVVRRLAPTDRVAPLLAEMAAGGGGVTAAELAHELELPEHLAALAIAACG